MLQLKCLIVPAISADGERRINGVIASVKLPLTWDQTDWGRRGGVISCLDYLPCPWPGVEDILSRRQSGLATTCVNRAGSSCPFSRLQVFTASGCTCQRVAVLFQTLLVMRGWVGV